MPRLATYRIAAPAVHHFLYSRPNIDGFPWWTRPIAGGVCPRSGRLILRLEGGTLAHVPEGTAEPIIDFMLSGAYPHPKQAANSNRRAFFAIEPSTLLDMIQNRLTAECFTNSPPKSARTVSAHWCSDLRCFYVEYRTDEFPSVPDGQFPPVLIMDTLDGEGHLISPERAEQIMSWKSPATDADPLAALASESAPTLRAGGSVPLSVSC